MSATRRAIEAVRLPPGVELERVAAEYGHLIGKVITFVVAFAVVSLLGRVVLLPVIERFLRARRFDPTVRSAGRSAASAGVTALALAVAFTLAGFGSVLTAFATLSAAVALAVGLAAQNLIGNVVAGVFILKDEPFDVGDDIEWADGSGRVEDISLRVTRVRNAENERVTVPNAALSDGVVTNVTAYDRVRETVGFDVGVGDDLDRAQRIAREETNAVDGVLSDPGPETHVTEFGAESVRLEAAYWVANPTAANRARIRSDVTQALAERFVAEEATRPADDSSASGGSTDDPA